MFGLHPSAPTRLDDYAADRAGRPFRNTRVRPRGLTPRRLAQLAGADPRGVRHATPDPWVPEPALVLSDVVAGPQPWTGTLLDPASPRPVPIGSLLRSAGPAPTRHWECAVAGGYGGDAVTAWIAETLRREIRKGGRRAAGYYHLILPVDVAFRDRRIAKQRTLDCLLQWIRRNANALDDESLTNYDLPGPGRGVYIAAKKLGSRLDARGEIGVSRPHPRRTVHPQQVRRSACGGGGPQLTDFPTPQVTLTSSGAFPRTPRRQVGNGFAERFRTSVRS